MVERTADHAALMNETYRFQRLIYDLTRAWFLLGRDHLIQDLAPPQSARILEIGCGTGRNLQQINRRWPGRRLYGLDISSEMLRTARVKIRNSARLAEADATAFDPVLHFGTDKFDRILFSYCISMIPDWERAVVEAMRCLAPGGSLHIVDFGDQCDLPAWVGSLLRNWIGRYHVTPRDSLPAVLSHVAEYAGGTMFHRQFHRSFAQYGVVRLG